LLEKTNKTKQTNDNNKKTVVIEIKIKNQIDQFRYIKINPTNSVVIPQSLALRIIVLD